MVCIKVRVDAERYYGPHTIANPIIVKTYINATLTGDASQEIRAIGSNVLSLARYDGYVGVTAETTASTVQNGSVGYVYRLNFRNSSLVSTHGTSIRYAKKYKYYICYPEGMTFKDFKYTYAWNFEDATFTDDPDNSRVIVEGKWGIDVYYRVGYVVPEGTANGVYTNSEYDYVEVEFYDGTR